MYDLLATILLPLGSIFLRSFNIVDRDNLIYMTVPISLCAVGMIIFNYIVAREQRNLFMLEKYTKKAQQEQMEIINLLPGGVMIVDPDSNDILFQNESVVDFNVTVD